MTAEYDKYYLTESLFGKPYPELIDFYTEIKNKTKLLDLGCGQGRNAIPLAQLGYDVTGIDSSKVGIQQLNTLAEKGKLPLKGFVDDIYTYDQFGDFEFILLDSMFHFGAKGKEKEINFLNRLFDESSPGTLITICIQKTGQKIEILNSIISSKDYLTPFKTIELIYKYEDKESNHSSKTKYEIITVKK